MSRSSSSPAASFRLDLLLIVFGTIGVIFSLIFYDRAFPLAALDLRLSRAEIAERAQEAIAAHGFDVTGYKSIMLFAEDGEATRFLHSTLGTEETNRLLREEGLPLWYWRVRWFQPQQQEEFNMGLSPDGTLLWLNHSIAEATPGAALSQEEARTQAERYLAKDRGWDLTLWEEVSASSVERPGGRMDHSFEWKRRDWQVAGSQLRLSVTVKGAEIGYYNTWLRVPESFNREFAAKYDMAIILDDVSSLGILGLLGIGLALALIKARWHLPLSFRRALIVALLVGGVVLLSEFNWWFLSDAFYSTIEDYTLHHFRYIFSIFMSVFMAVVGILLLWVTTHWMGKQVWHLEDRILSRRGDFWTNVAHSTGRGLALAGIHFGYLTLFYFIATEILGAWSPINVSYSNSYATPLPFVTAIEMGVVAAFQEEAAFRLFGIGAVLWLTSTFTRLSKGWRVALALLIPAVLWGFAHSTYVRDPIYFRGIELTVVGLLYGIVFLKSDLLTVIVAHCTYNALLTALPMLRSGQPAFVTSGLVVIAILIAPLFIWAARALRHRGVVRLPAPVIRNGVAEDAGALATLVADEETWRERLTAEKTVTLSLKAGDALVGVAAAEVQDETAQLLALTVAPAWRRQYWGSELLLALQQACRARGAQSLEVRTIAGNHACEQFFNAQQWSPAAKILQQSLEPPVPFSWRTLVRSLRRKPG